MCDIINNGININKNNLLFNKEHFVYIKNFINDDIRLKLLNNINKKEDLYKIKNKNSFLSILGQLDSTQNTSKENILKQHSVIAGTEIQQNFPDFHYYYHNCFADTVSKIVGKKVYPVNEINTMNNSLIIYENEDDSLRWHTDKSMFNNKKVYTLLVYLYNSSSQNLCYIDYDKNKKCLYTDENSCVILEHFTLEHAVTPLKQNEKKIVWSMTYAEDININNPISYIMNKSKNISYLGFGAFNSLDIFFIILLLIILIFIIFYFKKYIYQKIKFILFNNTKKNGRFK
uniref:Fe2OG dioxygenase domain-containing protein n=1 Tax=viral metagenome TaxID=1070528 RepID=A0A6C0JIU7_9ZZZZ